MTPDQFKALYGKALAGEESWAEAARSAKETTPKAGASAGTKAVSQVKQHRAAAVASAPSQADTAVVEPPASAAPPPTPPEAPRAPQNVKPDYSEDLAHAPSGPRVPLYTQVGGVTGAARQFAHNAGVVPGAVLGAASAAGHSIGDLWAGLGRSALDEASFQAQPAIDEAEFQAQPLLDETESYRKKLMDMLRASNPNQPVRR